MIQTNLCRVNRHSADNSLGEISSSDSDKSSKLVAHVDGHKGSMQLG